MLFFFVLRTQNHYLADFLALGRHLTKCYIEVTGAKFAHLDGEGDFHVTRKDAEVLGYLNQGYTIF